MIGNRIKLLRQSNGLSLQDLADLLKDSSLPIGKGAIAHYESGITVPTDEALETLAKVMGTTVDFFKSDGLANPQIFFLTPLEDTTMKYENQIQSFILIQLEKNSFIDQLLQNHIDCALPTRKKIKKGEEDEVEILADELRAEWGLGKQPVSSVSNTLEQNGWNLVEMENQNAYISGIEKSTKTGFLIYPSLFAIDDHRFELLASIGYAFLEGEDSKHTRKLVERFARAILLPRSQVDFEFISPTEYVSIPELTLVKQKYGISKWHIMRRLYELNFIGQESLSSFEDLLRLHGFPKRKRVLAEHLVFNEYPTLSTMRILEALSRGLIDNKQADSLLMIKHML